MYPLLISPPPSIPHPPSFRLQRFRSYRCILNRSNSVQVPLFILPFSFLLLGEVSVVNRMSLSLPSQQVNAPRANERSVTRVHRRLRGTPKCIGLPTPVAASLFVSYSRSLLSRNERQYVRGGLPRRARRTCVRWDALLLVAASSTSLRPLKGEKRQRQNGTDEMTKLEALGQGRSEDGVKGKIRVAPIGIRKCKERR